MSKIMVIDDDIKLSALLKDFLEPYTSIDSRYCLAVSYKNRQIWADKSESFILIWHDSTAKEFPDYSAIRSFTVPEPKQETYSACPLTIPRTGETTWVA